MKSFLEETKEGLFIADNTLWQLVHRKKPQCGDCKKTFHFSNCGWIPIKPGIDRCRISINVNSPILL